METKRLSVNVIFYYYNSYGKYTEKQNMLLDLIEKVQF